MNHYIKIGIYGVSSQSGLTYFADLISQGYSVNGYARNTAHGTSIVSSINTNGGIYMERPENLNNEFSKFVPLKQNYLGHNVLEMLENSSFIILAIPSNYQIEAVKFLKENGIIPMKIPIILSPSRTFATPYIWEILGKDYPVICFSTLPYSCKTIGLDRVYLKRRKRTWLASFEGVFTKNQLETIKIIFPQVTFTYVPALTSLNNIGAVFHPAAYLLNIEEIELKEMQGEVFSFYIDGIARKNNIAIKIEEIDQIRLQIADKLGIETFGLLSNPREEVWRKLINGLRALENEHENEIGILRKIRGQFLEYINSCVLSCQHWLDITYGVERISGEPLADTISRTPTYQINSTPQKRYIEEDIPTGLVPLEALADILKINHHAITELIDYYQSIICCDIRKEGRNLNQFSYEYIIDYLIGKSK